MKLFVSAAALALAFAAPVMAEEAPAATTAPAMTAEECSAEWTKCAADKACEEALTAKGCKAPEAAAK